MNQLQYYSNNNNLNGFSETLSSLMEAPHSEKTREQLRRVLCSLLPFFVFDTVYTTQHTQLLDILDHNIRVGNLNINAVQGGTVDIQRFANTLATTTNLKAVETLLPLVETLYATHFCGHSLDGIYAQMAQLQQQRISQSLETSVQPTVKRKI